MKNFAINDRIFVIIKHMNKTFTPFLLLLIIISIHSCEAQTVDDSDFSSKSKNTIIYFNPEIEPEVEEVRQATNDAFFISVSDYFSNISNAKMLRIQMPINFKDVNVEDIKDACKYNNAKYAVIPKVKFFKVGIGNYVLSSQVVVSMKLYNEKGIFLSENSYDTFRKKARILGSAENSVKIGTLGALKMMMKDWRKNKRSI